MTAVPNSPDAGAVARKFGIVPGCSILVIGAPAPSAERLRALCPPGVTLTDKANETGDGNDAGGYDLVFLWLTAPDDAADDLPVRFAALQARIVADGAIWVLLWKKPIARRRGVTLTWETMQAAALTTDLVDNKVATFSDEEYGTRFVLRRERRGR
jgi:hypothetical protein